MELSALAGHPQLIGCNIFPGEAPSITIAQLDADMHTQEKIRSVLPIYPSSIAQMINDKGNSDQGETTVINDDESTRVVYQGNIVNRSQPNPPSSNIIIHLSQDDDGQGSVNLSICDSGDPEIVTVMVQS